MITGLIIEGFMRVPYAHLDLAGAAIHAFYGLNEQGKSSIAEAVRFAYRGVSPRILKKGDYDMLVTRGKRTGTVELIEDDKPIRRNVRDGKVTTRADLNWDDTHIDIQLGATPFQYADEDVLRPMLIELFKARADDKMVRSRLKEKGVKDDLLEEAMPLIKKIGFASAAERAKSKKSEATGAWRSITGESYGHVKAETWRPDVLDTPLPAEAEITKWQAEVDRLTALRDSYRTALASAKATIELTGLVNEGWTLEDAETALKSSEQTLADCEAQIAAAKLRYDAAITKDEDNLRTADRELIEAKNAATHLSCPYCKVALQIVMVEGAPVLERGIEERNGSADVAAAAQKVNTAKLALQARKQGRESQLAAMNKTRGEAQDLVHQNRNTVDNVRKLQAMPSVTAEELQRLQTELREIEPKLTNAQAMLDDVQLKHKHHAQAKEKETKAKAQHELAQQWALIEEACGPTQAGIPAELIKKITTPINAAIAQIADMWGVHEVIINDDMSVQGHDGMPYVLLSESRRWQADAMIQLALARLTPLKVVCIDRFDVHLARGAFFDMLSQYTQENLDVTVLAFGSLKNTPPPFPGVKFYHVDNGVVTPIEHDQLENQQAEEAHAS